MANGTELGTARPSREDMQSFLQEGEGPVNREENQQETVDKDRMRAFLSGEEPVNAGESAVPTSEQTPADKESMRAFLESTEASQQMDEAVEERQQEAIDDDGDPGTLTNVRGQEVEVPRTGEEVDQDEQEAALRREAARSTRPESWWMKALHTIDRPRAASASYLQAALEGASLQEAAGEAWEGFTGEQTPWMSDWFFEQLRSARENPEDHPVARSLQRMFSVGIDYEVPSMEQGIARAANAYGRARNGELFGEDGAIKALTADRINTYERDEAKVDAALSTFGGIFTDIMIDPLTYTGAGLTRHGVTARARAAAKSRGVNISDPKTLDRLHKLESEGRLQEWGTTFADRLERGQVGIRISGVPVPESMTRNVTKGMRAFSRRASETPLIQPIGRMFNTRFGLSGENKMFADLEERLSNVLSYRKEQVLEDNIQYAKEADQIRKQISDDLGVNISREAVDQQVLRLIEDVEYSAAMKGVDYDTMRKGVQRESSEFRNFIRKTDPRRIRPNNLNINDRNMIASHPDVRRWAENLRNKNDAQIADEIAAGVQISRKGEVARDQVNRMSEAVQRARGEGLERVKNPVTGKMIKTENLARRADQLRRKADQEDRLAYFTHAVTPEARRAIAKRNRKSGSRRRHPQGGMAYSTRHDSAIERKWSQNTVEELNQMAREGKLPGYEGQKFNQFFHEDPVMAQTIRDLRHNRSMETARFMTDAKMRFGEDVENFATRRRRDGSPITPSNDQLPPGYRRPENPMASDTIFPEEVASRLDQHYHALNSEQSLDVFRNMIDKTTGWWKAWTLGIFPEYHFRNAMGNMWNNFVSGVNNPMVYGEAMDLQVGKQGAMRTRDGQEIPYDELRGAMELLGVKNRGFIGTDLEASLKAELGQGRWATLTRDNQLLHYANKYGKAVENNARIAKFIDSVRKGADFETAARDTKRTLFDYSDLTNFESNVAKRLMPFYTWSRKNIPYQMSQVLKTPGRYKGMDTTIQSIESNVEDPGEYAMARWMLDQYPVRVNIDEEDGKPRYFMLGNWHPAADVYKLSADLENLAKGQRDTRIPKLFQDLLNPLFKTPLEWSMNYNMFTNSAISEYEGQTVPILGDAVRVDAETAHVLKNIRLLTTLDSMLPSEHTGIFPETMRDQTPEEQLLKFMTGIRTYGMDFQRETSIRLREEQERMQELGFDLAQTQATTQQTERHLMETMSKREMNTILNRMADTQIEMMNLINGAPVDKETRDHIRDSLVQEERDNWEYLKDILQAGRKDVFGEGNEPSEDEEEARSVLERLENN